jgi:hypothetical protein
MATLTGPERQILELSLLSYEFDISGCSNDYDANWLVIGITARQGGQFWSGQAPTLLTWDVQRLVAWLRVIASGRTDALETFMGLENCLAFERQGIGEATRIRAVFAESLLPPNTSPGERASLTLKPGVMGLLHFAEDLDRERQSYPIRMIEDDGPAWFWKARLARG